MPSNAPIAVGRRRAASNRHLPPLTPDLAGKPTWNENWPLQASQKFADTEYAAYCTILPIVVPTKQKFKCTSEIIFPYLLIFRLHAARVPEIQVRF